MVDSSIHQISFLLTLSLLPGSVGRKNAQRGSREFFLSRTLLQRYYASVSRKKITGVSNEKGVQEINFSGEDVLNIERVDT